MDYDAAAHWTEMFVAHLRDMHIASFCIVAVVAGKAKTGKIAYGVLVDIPRQAPARLESDAECRKFWNMLSPVHGAM